MRLMVKRDQPLRFSYQGSVWSGAPRCSNTSARRLFHSTLLGAALVVGGCSAPAPTLILPPADLAECAEEPAPPVIPERDGTEATQRQRDVLMLEGYLRLREAYGDCKAKVDGLKAWRNEAAG